MKDKKCSDFVFMPLGDRATGSGATPRTIKPNQPPPKLLTRTPERSPKQPKRTPEYKQSPKQATNAQQSPKPHKKTPETDRLQKDRSSPADRLTPISNELESSISLSESNSPGRTEVRSKIVVVGSCVCGKSSLVHRYTRSTFLETYTPTGFETHTSQYSVSDTYKIHMSIWDTSGDAGYDRVRHLSYAEADLVIICFAIDNPTSMDEVITKWYPEIREHCPSQPVMLVGCKSDMRNEIKALPSDTPRPSFITYDQGLKTAKLINALVYSETSSKSSQRSVDDVMEVAALSSAGSKNGSSAACSSGHTTTASNGSTDSRATTASSNGSGGGSDSPNFRRQRSFIRRKRFTGMAEAKVQLRKEAAKSCSVM